MRPGGGKQKGSAFEREVCKKLSLWVSRGKHSDLFWRSAMSGGRATVAYKKNKLLRSAGDICSISPEGHAFCDQWYVECKHVKSLELDSFLIKQTGKLQKFWVKIRKESKRHCKLPMLIMRQNGWPVLVMTTAGHLSPDAPSLPCVAPLVQYHRSWNSVVIFGFEEMLQSPCSW